MNSIKSTQIFTKNYEKILKGIEIPKSDIYIDPFAGNCDLYNILPNKNWEFYDIEPQNNKITQRDTLLNPLNYNGKCVITNPPWLAKNKSNDKTIFNKYKLDDLYKCAIKSIIGCDSGVLIIPTNFFTDESSSNIRIEFLSKYKITKVNIFHEQVFEETPYATCSFSFTKSNIFLDQQNILFNNTNIILDIKYSYRIGGEFFDKYKHIKPIFGRIIENNISEKTNIYLNGVDTKHKKLHLEYDEKTYIGKVSDRQFATLSCEYKLNKNQEEIIIEEFNKYINNIRDTYNNLLFTIFRDNNRKRIPFDLVYKICTEIYKTKLKNN